MSVTVLNVAYPFAPVGADAVGGAEQVLSQLDSALSRSGDHSLVIACAGSQVAGRLFSIPVVEGPITTEVRLSIHQQVRHRLREVLERWPVDLVHLHGVDFLEYLPPAGVPVLVTLHLPPAWYPPGVFRLDRPATFLQGVSQSQHRACPPCPGLLPPIENGVSLDSFGSTRHARRSFAFALGRICPEKGFHLALRAARKAQVPLWLAGQVFPYEAHQRYFATEIAPHLDQQARFLGAVGLNRKRRLLAAARCLLVPSLAPETSSLVAMEALASGTPVVAFASGALPEIVEHGKTGFLVRDEDEMADALSALDEIDPENCRKAARERFSIEKTVRAYLRRYAELATPARSPLNRDLASCPPAPDFDARGRRSGPASPQSGWHIDAIRDFPDLLALRAEWLDLWRRCPSSTPFQSPDWLLSWWQQYKYFWGARDVPAFHLRLDSVGRGAGAGLAA
jgi:glycosyltransferase involved in cell wall biosynthesis